MSAITLTDQVHCQYAKNVGKWDMVDLLCEGEQELKRSDLSYSRDIYGINAGNSISYGNNYGRFILKPNPTDTSDTNEARYQQLVARAVLLNATGRTVNSMSGEVFSKPASVDLDGTGVEYLESNVDGNGVSLDQQSQEVIAQVVKKGRHGLLAEFPQTDGTVSQSDIRTGNIRPSIIEYKAQQILDWKYEYHGGIKKTVMIKLLEFVEDKENSSLTCYAEKCQYRWLLLIDGQYHQRVDEIGGAEGKPVVILDASGQPFDHIPFYTVGSVNNSIDVDMIPVLDLANVNIGHYRNSADVEEAAFICAQPTLFLKTNLGTDEFKKANPDGIQIGSRTGHNLGPDSGATLLQAEERNMLTTLMTDKKEDMKALGAALITPDRAQTAEATRTQKASEVSVLGRIVGNVVDAYTQLIIDCQRFITATPKEDFVFDLNRDFFATKMTAQDRQAWMADIQAGLATKPMYWMAMRKSDLIPYTMTDEEIEEQLLNQEPAFTGGEQ